MSKRTRVTLAMSVVVTLAVAAYWSVVALGGGGELAAAAMVVALGVGVDQLSKLILSFGPTQRR